ncbi:type IV secretory system conjugative DNA transfer family protein [Frankia sp. AgB1.9]|uniref:type IV secretory system conjugative DNA transfer family protein n=1 Tax=unclassified Frankia TaxID=2632575 RepID=UPI001931D8AF|nr:MULTISPECIES: type IV secretory system conjugative DNA transfer family protein [unclassified Frankia]MBL7487171.1 type IV secretory system conjugative DNA transfer family protein [Frankia sp. AgW1.1]MBL7547916.1 type IV secretory system conjugative DNA transfer family protein [Frankia sp. AgB1.9]MBL7623959.1 type IV secretory system conjugative DNA transfer family protein [Frankia sp. AgB1.8]
MCCWTSLRNSNARVAARAAQRGSCERSSEQTAKRRLDFETELDRLAALLTLGTLAAAGTGLGATLEHRRRDQLRYDQQRLSFTATFGRQVTAEELVAWMRSLTGLHRSRWSGHDSVAVEVIGRSSGISHQVRFPARAADDHIRQMQAAIPGVRLEPASAPAYQASGVWELRATHPFRPLRLDQPEQVAASILAALWPLAPDEMLVWQLVLAPAGGNGLIEAADVAALTGWRRYVLPLFASEPPRPDAEARRAAKAKAEEPLLTAAVRIGAHAATRAKTRALLSRLGRVAGSLSAPGIRLIPQDRGRGGVMRLDRAATPTGEVPVLLNAAEAAAMAGIQIGGPMLPGVSYGGGQLLPASAVVSSRGRIVGDGLASGSQRPVALTERGAMEHLVCVAPTGGGKSTLLASLALSDLEAGRSVIVIDPKGGLVARLLERIPAHRIADCIVVDPTDERPVPLPLLATEPGGDAELTVDNLVAILHHRYGDLGPRSTDLLTSSLHTLMRVPDTTILDLFRLWTDERFRLQAVARVQNDPVLAPFWSWFGALGAAERAAMLAAPSNKLRPLISRRMARTVLAAPRSTFSMSEVLSGRKVLLVNLAEGALGSEVTNLLGGVLVARLWGAIQGRIRLDPGARPPAFVTIDEAPRFLDSPVDLADMLVLAREYGVGLSLAAQSPTQFPPALRSVVLNSARSKISFQASAGDAKILAPEFGPLVTPEALMSLPPFEAIARLSIGGGVADPVSIRTRPLPEPIPGRAAEVAALSRSRYGVDRAEIEAGFAPVPEPPEDGPVGRGRAI